MFTTLSSHIERITYAKAIDATLHIKASQMDRKGSKDVTKYPKVQGLFSGDLSLGEGFGCQNQQWNIQGGAAFSRPSQMSISTSGSCAIGVSNPRA